MRIAFLITALFLATASAQVTVFQIPALPSGQVKSPVASPSPDRPAVQGAVARVELQDVEVTVPVSTNPTPLEASEDAGEVDVPVLATDQNGRPVSGVEVNWTVKNTGKAAVFVISSHSAGNQLKITATIEPGATGTYTTTTGIDGLTSLLLNAASSTSAVVQPVTLLGEVKNMRSAVQSIDWLGQ